MVGAAMPESVRALVNPNILRWARETAQMSLDMAASRLHVKPDKLSAWEAGTERPTIKQARKLGHVYRRPFTVFLFSDLPSRPTLEYAQAYRRLPGGGTESKSPELIFALRAAEAKRRAAIDLYSASHQQPPDVPPLLAEDMDTEEAGAVLREFLGVTLDQSRAPFRDPYEALTFWRETIESHGILVFQMPRVPLGEMRAVSVPERPLPFIVLNPKDAPNGRAFSLLHEAAHILLSASADAAASHLRSAPETQPIEVFCNAVAASAMLPRPVVMRMLEQLENSPRSLSNSEIRRHTHHWGVSVDSFLRRLVTLGQVDLAFYQERHAQLNQQEAGESPDGGNYYRNQVKLNGTLLSRLVSDAIAAGRLSTWDGSEILGIKVNQLDNYDRTVADQLERFSRVQGLNVQP